MTRIDGRPAGTNFAAVASLPVFLPTADLIITAPGGSRLLRRTLPHTIATVSDKGSIAVLQSDTQQDNAIVLGPGCVRSTRILLQLLESCWRFSHSLLVFDYGQFTGLVIEYRLVGPCLNENAVDRHVFVESHLLSGWLRQCDSTCNSTHHK